MQNLLRLIYATLLISNVTQASILGRSLAITFDDAPRDSGNIFTGSERTKFLIEQLHRSQIKQAAFFCNTENLGRSDKARLEQYANAGHLIANHTHRHADLDQVTIEDFIGEIDTAHEFLKDFTNFRLLFRFPYLREGNTKTKRNGIRKALAQRRYRDGYVTINNSDWFMENLVQDALSAGIKINFKRLQQTYVSVLINNIEFYDAMAQRTLGRSPKHVLLLHENDLAALFIFDLTKELTHRGWSITSVDDAYTDPIAQQEPETLFSGQGRIAALAYQQGDTGTFAIWESEEAIENLFQKNKIFETTTPPEN